MTGEDVIAWAKNHPGISRFMVIIAPDPALAGFLICSSRTQVPREVEILDELPKTSTGKVKKNVLRDWARGGSRSEM